MCLYIKETDSPQHLVAPSNSYGCIDKSAVMLFNVFFLTFTVVDPDIKVWVVPIPYTVTVQLVDAPAAYTAYIANISAGVDAGVIGSAGFGSVITVDYMYKSTPA